MFLYQKFNYEVSEITLDNFANFESDYRADPPESYSCFDTETNGLHIITSTPFLYSFAYTSKSGIKKAYWFEVNKELVRKFVELTSDKNVCKRLFAHNCKYDYHMTWNVLGDIPEEWDEVVADSITVARLTSFADEKISLSLESLGTEYVDDSAKFAGKVIKDRIKKLNREFKNKAKAAFYEEFGRKAKFGVAWANFHHKVVPYVNDDDEYNKFFMEHYRDANYQDVYNYDKDLMVSYAIDDVVIENEYLAKSLQALMVANPDLKVFNSECTLISVVARMERVGLKLDIDYTLESRKKLVEEMETKYKLLEEISGEKFSIGQHALIKKIFKEKWGVVLDKSDIGALNSISEPKEAATVANLIVRLRTLEKYLSTYIDGKLKAMVNGRVFTSVNSSGAVSGRVSCDMQQQPKEPLRYDNGDVLFHPRCMFITDDDYVFIYADQSQMELRMQAYYTILISGGDLHMCRAYIPFKCESIITGEEFDYTSRDDLDRWDSGEWVLKEDPSTEWSPTDLHSRTTFIAFPHLNNDPTHPEFKHCRKLGKMCNFLKNYQGGIGAITSSLDVSREIAENLDSAYYQAFPKIKEYQEWVNQELIQQGYVSNLYGRRYYMQSARSFYKAGNYVIQGTCADMLKTAEISLDKLLKGKKSKFVLPIHDEVCVAVHKDEHYLIPMIRDIMQDTYDYMKYVPMICDVEIAPHNWGEKQDWVDPKGEYNG